MTFLLQLFGYRSDETCRLQQFLTHPYYIKAKLQNQVSS